eukprot:Seg2157.1 transcript_id=Seg2157.1/GoldUCD/mRNA.D3Y31 product="Acyl-coenzyme A thioesterase 9 mitochondrial" protein_id=Seg2157.1/GoldUCD/D3Y31
MSKILARLLHSGLSFNLRATSRASNLGLNTKPGAIFCCERIGRRQSSSSADQMKSDEVITSKNMRKILKEYVGGARYFFEEATSSDVSSDSLIKQVISQDELETRSMKDSIREAVIPLGDNPDVRDKYLTFYKTVRIGKLLEDMDTLAGLVGYKYYKGPSEYENRAPFALVTASVDKFKLKESFIRSDRNIRMTGFVSYAGKTSLEITIHLDQENENSRKRVAEATFVMVARDPVKNKGMIVNRLLPASEEEQAIFAKSAQTRKDKRLTGAQSLFKAAPTADERNIIHELFLNTLDPKKSTFHSRVKPENTVWMEQTRLKNIIICHPQSRNVYNKIFGGFLMREAFELGWATTCVHVKSKPSIVCMDDINFKKPVEVGSLLFLSSQIVFTDGNYLQTRVHAEVLDPKTGHIDTTNVFHFHFTCAKEFPQIIPMSYGEYMLYLEGRRHSINHLENDEQNI